MSMNTGSRTTRTRLVAEEDGASMVVLALTLVVLMGFAAIAVDAAAAWALRRTDQSGADTGAVAGAIFTAERTKAQAMQDAEEEIIRITYSTINPDMSFTDWEAEWAACTDPAKPGEFTENHSSSCVSFNSNLSKVRVRTPIVPWKTTFARVIGFDEVQTFAEAEVDTVYRAAGGVMPFGLPGSTANDAEICLKTGANPKGGGTCDGPDSGNFGFIDFSQFGNDQLGTPTKCTGGGTDRLARNIAQGVDHPLGTTNVFPAPLRDDVAACNDGNFNSRPYNVDTETGNIAQVLYDGFVEGVDGLPGRLDRGTNQITIGTGSGQVSLDNTPLWTYLNGNGISVCGTVTSHDDLIDNCLDRTLNPGNYTAGVWKHGAIFADTILNAPRFGWVPLFHEDDLGAGTSNRTIREFRPVYIQTTLWGCNAGGCTTYWDPAEALVGDQPKKNDLIEAATAINLPREMFPSKVTDTEPGTDNSVSYLLSK